MKVSTNALTARYCAMRGWACETTQRFYGGRRHDLFGIVDSIILRPPKALWVQNCSYGTLNAHRDAIDASPHIAALKEIRGIEIQLWEWKKKRVGRRGMWFLRVQVRGGYGAWDDAGEWIGPIDLYPTKTK